MDHDRRRGMRRLFREPLVHFLALGAVLFGVGLLRGEIAEPTVNRIAITPGVVERLIEGFRLTWQRPPTEDEFRGLVEEHLREEVLYREALAMGLDRDDQIIRRRLRQKLEFLTADVVESFEPTRDELQAHLDADPHRYRQEAVFSFRQVYLRTEPDAEQAGARARSMLDKLTKSPAVDPEAIGDPFLHPGVFDDITERQLAGVFGADFAAAVVSLPVGDWSGPITSPFGLHLARVDRLVPERLSTLDEVRDAVYRDLVSERTREAEQRYFEGLLSQYTVTAEWPEGMEPVSIPGVVP